MNRIIIDISGGVVQNIVSEVPTEYILLDYDIEGADVDTICTIDELEVVTVEGLTNVNSQLVDHIFTECNPNTIDYTIRHYQ